jgi:hypothetical protein
VVLQLGVGGGLKPLTIKIQQITIYYTGVRDGWILLNDLSNKKGT